MKLSNLTILALRGTDPDTKGVLADAMGVTLNTLYRYLNENHENLTRAAALEVIRKITGLSDNEILERETTEAQG